MAASIISIIQIANVWSVLKDPNGGYTLTV